MSQATGISPASVMRIWHAFGLKPHRRLLYNAITRAKGQSLVLAQIARAMTLPPFAYPD